MRNIQKIVLGESMVWVAKIKSFAVDTLCNSASLFRSGVGESLEILHKYAPEFME